MELSSLKSKNFLTFSQKKFFLYLRKWNFQAPKIFSYFREKNFPASSLKTSFIFLKKSFSYILGKETF